MSDIRLNSDLSLTDHQVGPDYKVGAITNFNGDCDVHIWIAPKTNTGLSMFVAADLRRIAEILDNADAAVKEVRG